MSNVIDLNEYRAEKRFSEVMDKAEMEELLFGPYNPALMKDFDALRTAQKLIDKEKGNE